ncbi:MAG: iron ABC transporter substrate-binding protein, partial [Dehalococcoidia bacterium]|nr:iron ABC transporter substrate-binding protein [Dehalococcoidia bacterium]
MHGLFSRSLVSLWFVLLATMVALSGCLGSGSTTSQSSQPSDQKVDGTITVYSGRNEKLIAPLIERFQKETGVEVKVRYGDTAQLAAAILEEGNNSPADVYFAQDAGALGALSSQNKLAKLSDSVFSKVDAKFRSTKGDWVGISGRARTVVYNTRTLKPENLPDSILGFTDAKWKGKIGWAPTNGSFQAFATALVVTQGEEKAKQWLQGIKANDPKVYANNTAIVQAVGDGEIEVGFVNHYYLFSFLKEKGESFPVRNYHPRSGDVGSMMNVAGAGVLTTAKNAKAAEKFVEYMLSKESQQYFADETFEYPLVEGIKTHPAIVPIAQIKLPKVDLAALADLQKTLKL